MQIGRSSKKDGYPSIDLRKFTNYATNFIEQCKSIQQGRVSNNATKVAIDLQKLGFAILDYNKINSSITTDILDQCKTYQKGRVVKNTTSVVFDFSEKILGHVF